MRLALSPALAPIFIQHLLSALERDFSGTDLHQREVVEVGVGGKVLCFAVLTGVPSPAQVSLCISICILGGGLLADMFDGLRVNAVTRRKAWRRGVPSSRLHAVKQVWSCLFRA